jgi:hypothetical protein
MAKNGQKRVKKGLKMAKSQQKHPFFGLFWPILALRGPLPKGLKYPQNGQKGVKNGQKRPFLGILE